MHESEKVKVTSLSRVRLLATPWAAVENNRMGKTRDRFKKMRDTKGIFHAKMGSIKDRNGMDPTEAEDIKKRWQQYAENYTKKIFTNQIITIV